MINKLNLGIIKHDDYESIHLTVGIYIGDKYTECSILKKSNAYIRCSRTITFMLAGTTFLMVEEEGDIYLHNKLIFSPESELPFGNINIIPQELPEIINVLQIFRKAFQYNLIGKCIIEDTFKTIKQKIEL